MEFINKELKRKMFLIFFGILVWWLFSNIELVGKYLAIFITAISPLVIGFIISFILNKPMMFFETKLLRSNKIKVKYKKILSLLLTLMAFVLLIILLLLIIIPNLIEVGIELGDRFPSYINALDKYIKGSAIEHSRLSEWIESIDIEKIKENSYNFIKGGLSGWLSSSFAIASSVFGSVISFLIGAVFSIYFLIQKEGLIKNIKKLLFTILPQKVFNKILYIGSITSKTFSSFILAQALEAIILGIIFFLSMTLLKLPYAGMISIVIAVFSIIPMLGAFVGLFIGIILIFVESPQLSGLFIILFFALQQIESNFIYPRIVGRLSGLSPLLTLAAVTLGGSLMGILGMLLFVPLFSVIQKLVDDSMKNAPQD